GAGCPKLTPPKRTQFSGDSSIPIDLDCLASIFNDHAMISHFMKQCSFFCMALASWLAPTASLTAQDAPAVLPGRGLAQHDFFYAGEGGGTHNMYIVRKGKVDWS